MKGRPVNIAIFASGSGSNAEKIIKFFEGREDVKVNLLLSNKPDAFALQRAQKAGVDTFVFNKEKFTDGTEILSVLKSKNIDWIVLAGFLWLVPDYLIKNFRNRIINIHPALLPSYGGKGMYGMNVHKAVIDACEKESGISIHFINEKYDEGEIIFQFKCPIEEGETPESLAEKIHKLEHEHFPAVIDELIKKSV